MTVLTEIKMRKAVLSILVFISLVALGVRYGSEPLIKALKLQPRAGLRVESNQKMKVFIDSREAGVTTFQDENLIEGEYLVELKPWGGSGEASSSAALVNFPWRSYIKLNAGTLTVVNREFSKTVAASAGEVINLEKGKGAVVISTPDEAEVSVDGVVKGRTPLSIDNIEAGEHQFVVDKDNYLKRGIKASLVEGYNLILSVDLALAEADLTKLPTIPISATSQVIIKATPTGFLRVRSAPNLSGKEMARVSPGEALTLLEELPAWYRVRLEDGQEGYISAAYASKKSGN